MRLIIGISLLLVGIGTLSCRIEGVAQRDAAATGTSQWVRTVDGWELAAAWHSERVTPPRVHPLVVAAGQGLLSIFALIVFDRQATRKLGQR